MIGPLVRLFERSQPLLFFNNTFSLFIEDIRTTFSLNSEASNLPRRISAAASRCLSSLSSVSFATTFTQTYNKRLLASTFRFDRREAESCARSDIQSGPLFARV
jgi:hypothetical protein